MRLEGKRALITGSSQGIGAEIASRFAEEGAFVVVNHRTSPEHSEGILKSIKRSGGKGIAVHSDVSDPESISRMFAEIRRRVGGLDILVNTAGYSDSRLWDLPIGRLSLDSWKRVFAVDAFGTFLCIQGAVRLMKSGSSILNVASTPALAGDTEGLVYASAKGAVIAMTRMLAKSLAPRVRVNCMVFGSIKTTWVDWLEPDQVRSYLAAIPMGRFGKPREAAELALFLASDESSFMTGQLLVLDGGETLH